MSESVGDLPPDSPGASLARSTAGMAAGTIASRGKSVV